VKNPLRSVKQAFDRRSIRQTPAGFGCALADRIAYVDAAAWDALTNSHSVLMSRRYLKTLEEHGPSNIVGRYAIVYRGDEPLAAIAAQRVTIRGDQIDSPTAAAPSRGRKAVGKLVHPLRAVSQEMLVCGNLLSWGDHGIAISPKADKSIFRGIAETLYRMRRAAPTRFLERPIS